MNKLTLAVFLSLSLSLLSRAQGGFDDMGIIVLDQVIVGDDTLPAVKLEPVEIKAHLVDRVPELDYKLKYHTRKAYPYAIRVSRIVAEIDEELSKLDGKREQKKYLNSTEKLLKDEFKDDLKELTRTQGRILIKLVDRETGYSVHELIGMYRSDFKAGWWEFLAKRFDMSIKDRHDPEGEDRALEKYVQQLDLLYQRNGKKEKIENEQLDLSVQSKKRKRKRDSDESVQGESFDDR
ncbi:MAG: DUF4294 domain-containing protein [Chitinophagales bacterium]